MHFARNFLGFSFRLMHRIVELITHSLLWLIYRGSGEKMPPINNLLLLESATSLAHKIRTKKVTSTEVVQSFISRIAEVNPVLNSVVDNRFEDALMEAKSVDKYLEATDKTQEEIKREKPFLGVPFTTKDCIAVTGLSQSSGLYYRKDYKATEDAETIALMRKAGAIPIAVTNVSELCMWWESNNTVYGRTNNPYNTNHIVGGSSGGEACLLAAAGSAMGIGSDIGGSIRMPAFFNGIFGHKPSALVISNKGQYPIPASDDQRSFLTVGPMSRYATDILPMFKVMSGVNAAKLKLDEKVDITKLKYFYAEDDGGSLLVSSVEPEIKAAVGKVVTHLQKTHGVVAQRIVLSKLQKSTAIWIAKMKVESGPQLPDELANNKGKVNIFHEAMKFPFGLSHHTLVAIATGLVENIGFRHGSPKHQYLCAVGDQLKAEIQDILGTNGVLIYPTHPTAAPYHCEPLIKPFNFSYTGIVNILGLPSTHCPMGLNSQGLPIGVQIIGAREQDRHTIAVAEELEKAFGGWVPPPIIA